MLGLPIAAQAQAPPLLHACYVQQSGVVYRVGLPGLRSETAECVSPNHILFSWNEEGEPGAAGPAGPAGADGISGREVIEEVFSVAARQPVFALVDCPAGKDVFGGGWLMDGGTGPNQLFNHVSVNRPVGTGWQVSAFNLSSLTLQLTVYAVCAG